MRIHPLVQKVKKAIDGHRMIRAGDTVLVGVSGGPDSVALLHSLAELRRPLRFQLGLVHLNHRLRGRQSEGDEAFVRALARKLGFNCIVQAVDVRAVASASRSNLEEAARKARLDFFRRAMEQSGAGKVALGHTRNDQAETLLMQLLRGAGLEGLVGMPPVKDGWLLRPLLEVSRQEVLDYLKSRRADFRVDASNLDLSYTRNRIRGRLIPFLEREFQASVVENLARTALVLQADLEFIQGQVETLFSRLFQQEEKGGALSVAELVVLPAGLQRRLVRLAIQQVKGDLRGLELEHVEAVRRLLEPSRSGRRIRLPGRISVAREFDQLRVERGVETGVAPAFRYPLNLPGAVFVPEAGGWVRAGPSVRPVRRSGLSVRISLAKIPPGLTVRSRLPGDRYRPQGRRTYRKLKDLFIEARVPLARRNRVPLVVADGEIIWVPGFPPAAGFKPGARDRSITLAFDLEGVAPS
ncbi:MAG: tRNA lysidine(34) synthetase TilS [Acidobacteria bacterium]|nr:tRNA lysidine(34) synthetase TilS [Acidobacteriota bacterium]